MENPFLELERNRVVTTTHEWWGTRGEQNGGVVTAFHCCLEATNGRTERPRLSRRSTPLQTGRPVSRLVGRRPELLSNHSDRKQTPQLSVCSDPLSASSPRQAGTCQLADRPFRCIHYELLITVSTRSQVTINLQSIV